MTILKTIIVDDEPLARKGMAIRLKNYDAIELIEQCVNGREAIQAIKEKEPDLVFLDIQMPGMNGFDVIKALTGLQKIPMFVFVTAFDEFAVDAFEVHAIDYLLKPIDQDKLDRAIERVLEQHIHQEENSQKKRLIEFVVKLTGEPENIIVEQVEDGKPLKLNEYPPTLVIKDRSTYTKINMEDIDWVDAAGDYMCVHANGETHIMRCTMKALEQQLSPKLFQRIHRSAIINLTKVDKISTHINGEYYLQLINGQKLKMSRGYKNKIKYFLD